MTGLRQDASAAADTRRSRRKVGESELIRATKTVFTFLANAALMRRPQRCPTLDTHQRLSSRIAECPTVDTHPRASFQVVRSRALRKSVPPGHTPRLRPRMLSAGRAAASHCRDTPCELRSCPASKTVLHMNFQLPLQDANLGSHRSRSRPADRQESVPPGHTFL